MTGVRKPWQLLPRPLSLIFMIVLFARRSIAGGWATVQVGKKMWLRMYGVIISLFADVDRSSCREMKAY